MSGKLEFYHQKSKNMERRETNNRPKSQTKESRDTNTLKLVRCESMDRLKPQFSCDPHLPVDSPSDVSERIQDEKTTEHCTPVCDMGLWHYQEQHYFNSLYSILHVI